MREMTSYLYSPDWAHALKLQWQSQPACTHAASEGFCYGVQRGAGWWSWKGEASLQIYGGEILFGRKWKQWKECWGICSVRRFARKRADGSQTHENGCALAGAEQPTILARRIDSGPVGRMNGLPETGWLLLLVLIWRNAFQHWAVLPRFIHPFPNETTVYWFQWGKVSIVLEGNGEDSSCLLPKVLV